MSGGEEMARALWYVAPGRVEIRPERLAPLAEGSVRVRARYGAISRGTEALVASGRVPRSEYQRMRSPFMGGAFPFPVKHGYATVGRVVAGPAGLIGRMVFALHPHQTAFDLPADAAVPLPAEVSPTRATLAANMETALNASWDAAPGPSGRVAVIGAGVVGTLTAFVCAQNPAVEVTLVDIDRSRETLARTLGIAFATPDRAPRDCAYVFNASASAEGLATALDIAADEGSVIELSWYGTEPVAVPLGGAFHSRRLKLISSQVGKVAPSRRAGTTPRQRLEAALKLTADPRLDALLAPAVAFDELPARIADVLKPKSGVLCQLIQYP